MAKRVNDKKWDIYLSDKDGTVIIGADFCEVLSSGALMLINGEPTFSMASGSVVPGTEPVVKRCIAAGSWKGFFEVVEED